MKGGAALAPAELEEVLYNHPDILGALVCIHTHLLSRLSHDHKPIVLAVKQNELIRSYSFHAMSLNVHSLESVPLAYCNIFIFSFYEQSIEVHI